MKKPAARTCDEENWYLVQVKSNSFRIAERALGRQSFKVFCPVFDAVQVRAGKSSISKKPLFPGYLFVGFNPSDAPWGAINNTPGVSRLVTFGSNYPQAVPKPLIEGLMARCDQEGRLLPVEALQPGDQIRITSGPFADLVSEIESIGADQRVYLLLHILGRASKIGIRPVNVSKL